MRFLLCILFVLVAFVAGVVAESRIGVVNKFTRCCDVVVDKNECTCNDCDCCKGCSGNPEFNGKCDCEKCDCCKQCVGKKKLKNKCCK